MMKPAIKFFAKPALEHLYSFQLRIIIGTKFARLLFNFNTNEINCEVIERSKIEIFVIFSNMKFLMAAVNNRDFGKKR